MLCRQHICALARDGTSGVVLLFLIKMNSGARDAAQTGHKREATKTGRHVVTQGSLGDGGQFFTFLTN